MKANLALTLLFACSHPCHAGTAPKPETRRPNILLLVADDLGWNDVGYHGGGIQTPNIDQLGKAGAVLNQFYVMPSCTPTRASLMTGRYTIRYGLQISVIKPFHRHGLPLDERILPQALKEAGYETAIVGKWHLGHSHPGYLPTHRGFDHQYGCYNGMIDYVTHTMNEDLKWDAQLVEPEKIATPTDELLGHDWHRNDKTLYEKGYATDLIRDEAIRVIKERDSSKPLFLYVPFTDPHTPLQAKAADLEPYEDAELDLPDAFGPNGPSNAKRLDNRRHFAAMVSGMDGAIGEILQTLKEQGMADNTVVVFLSDNGGSYQGGNNDPLRGQKMLLYEGGVRVPAIISFPGKIKPGTTVDEPLHVVDLYPTLLKMAGAPLEEKHPLDGLDIWPTITDGAPSPHQEILLNAREGRSSAIRIGDWKLVKNGALGPLKTIGEKDDVFELFNLKDDPLEKTNLAGQQPKKLEQLKRRLDVYTKEAVAPLYTDLQKGSEPTPRTWRPSWWTNEREKTAN